MHMKKKTFFLIALAVVVAVAFTAVGIRGAVRYGFLEGRILIADDGSYLIILDDYSPIRMSDQSKKGGLFLGLQTGDRVRVLHDRVRLSYPGQTNVYRLRLLERGTRDDIPEEIFRALEQLGWVGGQS